MSTIGEGSSLISTVTALFKKAINNAFPEIAITNADTLVNNIFIIVNDVGRPKQQH